MTKQTSTVKHTTWDQADIHYLRRLYADGVNVRIIAELLDRTEGAVYAKASQCNMERGKPQQDKNIMAPPPYTITTKPEVLSQRKQEHFAWKESHWILLATGAATFVVGYIVGNLL